MKPIVVAVMALVMAGAVLAVDLGLKPHPKVSDYPAHVSQNDASLGAAVLDSDEVKKAFATELYRGYIVVEVGFYPSATGSVDVNIHDFVLRLEKNKRLRPAEPEAIAAGLQRQDQPTDREVTIHPTVGVGYESGDRYDPTYGRRRGGWTTSVGVGVGVGNAPPVASTPADRETMEIELHEKGLPEGVTTKPVAGYLYFPAPKRYRRTVPWTLEYNGLDERVKVDLKR